MVEQLAARVESALAMFEIVSTCKGGGYRYARTNPVHPKANKNGLYPLHRVLMENHLGRLLEDGEVVHHKDEDKNNNAIENLALMTNAEHSCLHSRKKQLVKLECCVCKKELHLRPHVYKQRVSRNKCGMLTCGARCGSIQGHISKK